MVERYVFVVKVVAPTTWSARNGNISTRRRPKYLFSGLTKCSCCGGGYSAISATLIGCATARNKGTGIDHNLQSTPVKMVAGGRPHHNLLFRAAA
ncbi:hypothetical protein [Pseudochelatococcus contaminans]|uniref:hypothetical protein n=1 Tax=Pseudochelatococcus contaminans TaxID=1538103 RepID=UPI00162275EE|nr:hypothetical protein [Pseudochelatococcus contaminans]